MLPAVSLSDASHSAAYLASFCVASILIMASAALVCITHLPRFNPPSLSSTLF